MDRRHDATLCSQKFNNLRRRCSWNKLNKGRETTGTEKETSKTGLFVDKSIQNTYSMAADKSFAEEFLHAHNEYRRQHGTPPLTINPNLNSSAQAWAETLLPIKTLKHSNTNLGENLYYTYSSPPKKVSGYTAVDKWYKEINKYDFQKPGYSSATDHFTQVVWKDSKELGVGVATNGTTTIVVGHYSPAGNINSGSYFEKNVLPRQMP